FSQAISAVDRAIELSPNDPNFHYWKAQQYFVEEEHDNIALAEITRSCELAPSLNLTWQLKADLLVRMNRLTEALECANRAIKLDRKSYPAYSTKAVVFVRQGKAQAAEDCLTSALPCQDNELHLHRARLAAQLKHWPLVLEDTTSLFAYKKFHKETMG